MAGRREEEKKKGEGRREEEGRRGRGRGEEGKGGRKKKRNKTNKTNKTKKYQHPGSNWRFFSPAAGLFLAPASLTVPDARVFVHVRLYSFVCPFETFRS